MIKFVASNGKFMRKILAAVLLMIAFNLHGQENVNKGYEEQFDIYSTKYAQEVVDFLADKRLKGREAGTKGCRIAMEFIEKELASAGYQVERQEITSDALTAAIGEPKPGKVYPDKMTNLIAHIEGKSSEKSVVVGAHYDHLGKKKGVGIHPGADDNASGIVALLSLAKMMKASGITPEYTILFCAWDGEEKGLLGSKYFVSDWYSSKQPQDSICLYMNFDMVGRTATIDNPAVTFAWNDNFPYLKEECEEALHSIVQPFTVLYDRRLGDGKGGSDYAPFSAHNIPYIAWMEDLMHEDYHKPTDTPDKIHWNKLRKTTLLAYAILYGLVTK